MRKVSLWRTAILMFVVLGVTFGFASALRSSRAEGRLERGIRDGALFGGLMAATLTGLHYHFGRRFAQNGVPYVVQTADVVLQIAPGPATDAVTTVMRELGARDVRLFSEAPIRVTARTRMSWRSWGEKIEAEITPAGGSGSLVRVHSQPLIGLTLVDYGKGMENVKRFVAALKSADSNGVRRPG